MTGWRRLVACLLALALAAPLPLLAQSAGSSGPFSPAELEQIAAPIALYPDALLAQVLMAATYPIEIVLAERFLQANATLTAETRDEALRAQPWDDSVKSLVSFPQVLAMMSDRLEWTQKLGDAFLAQPDELMDAIQRLRARAHAEGTLASTPQQTVTVEPGLEQPMFTIEAATPGVVYVPTYDPRVVFGEWPYPAYPPYYYYPPGWFVPGAFFTFGVGIVVGVALWGVCDWHHHYVGFDVEGYHRFTRIVNHERQWGGLAQHRPPPPTGRFVWQHDPQHRRGAGYRDEATWQRFGGARAPGSAAREIFRGRPEQPLRLEPGGGGAPPSRAVIPPSPPPAPGRAQPPTSPRPEPGRLSTPGLAEPRGPSVFQGLGRGPDVRGYSDRGRESRQSIRPPTPTIRSAPGKAAPGGGIRSAPAPGRRR